MNNESSDEVFNSRVAESKRLFEFALYELESALLAAKLANAEIDSQEGYQAVAYLIGAKQEIQKRIKDMA